MAQIGGWNVNKVSTANAIVIAEKVSPNAGGTMPLGAIKQHVVFGFDATFSGVPASPVPISLVCPDVSPNIVLWSGYVVGGSLVKSFSEGLAAPIGGGVELVLNGGGGSLIGSVNLHGVTR